MELPLEWCFLGFLSSQKYLKSVIVTTLQMHLFMTNENTVQCPRNTAGEGNVLILA